MAKKENSDRRMSLREGEGLLTLCFVVAKFRKGNKTASLRRGGGSFLKLSSPWSRNVF